MDNCLVGVKVLIFKQDTMIRVCWSLRKKIDPSFFQNIPIRRVAAGDKFSIVVAGYDCSQTQLTSTLKELHTDEIMERNNLKLENFEDNDKLHPLVVISYLIATIDRNCKTISPNINEFWSAQQNLKTHYAASETKNIVAAGGANNVANVATGNGNNNNNNKMTDNESFTYQLSRETFILLNNLLLYCIQQIRANVYGQISLPKLPKLPQKKLNIENKPNVTDNSTTNNNNVNNDNTQVLELKEKEEKEQKEAPLIISSTLSSPSSVIVPSTERNEIQVKNENNIIANEENRSIEKIEKEEAFEEIKTETEWDGWLWWLCLSILRILKAHFYQLSNNKQIYKTRFMSLVLCG